MHAASFYDDSSSLKITFFLVSVEHTQNVEGAQSAPMYEVAQNRPCEVGSGLSITFPSLSEPSSWIIANHRKQVTT